MSEFQSSVIKFHRGVARMHNIPNFVSTVDMDFTQISNLHDHTSKLIHTKYHLKSYHIGINYRMTLTTICSVPRRRTNWGEEGG